jgi:ABC-type multidrug transport system fused ATPase/permease subunit
VVDLIELLGALIVIAVATYELQQGWLTLGGLFAFLGYMTQLFSPVRGLSRLSNTLYSASAGAERVIELLDEQPCVREPERPRPLRCAEGWLSFESVSFAYEGSLVPAVEDVTLQVGPGQTLALVGASGSGKSTLAKLALRLYDPLSGNVQLDGIDLRQLVIEDLRRNVALVLQETLIFHDTIRENIRWGRPDASDGEVVAAAQAADSHNFIVQLPDGYDTVVGQRGRRLSGGQRQRLAIARAVVRNAPVLVLDEPTAALDAEAARRVLEPLRRLMAGRTTIIISHDLAVVREATEIAVLEAGRVIERGAHDELVSLGGRYARLNALHRGETVVG